MSEGLLRDDTGDNISKKNKHYCELTGLYWIWKNSQEHDVVGLCHYRRFLTHGNIIHSKQVIDKDDLLRDFVTNDVDILLPQIKLSWKKAVYKKCYAPSADDMHYVRKVISQKCPEYLHAYDKYVNGKKSYYCNVMVAKREVFNQYCEWLFDILFQVEKVMPLDSYIHDAYRSRMFGFLSERLLNVWVIFHRELKIKEYPMVKTDQNILVRMKEFAKQQVYKILNI